MESPCLERRDASERVTEDDRDVLGRILGAQPGAGRARAKRHARAGVQPLPVQQAAARRAVQLQVPARGAHQQAAVVAPRAAHAMHEESLRQRRAPGARLAFIARAPAGYAVPQVPAQGAHLQVFLDPTQG